MPFQDVSPAFQLYVPLVSVAISLLVIFFVLRQGIEKPINFVIVGFALASVHYNVFQALFFSYPSIWLVRAGYIGSIVLIPLMMDFPDAVIDARFCRPAMRNLAWALSGLFLLMLPTDLLLRAEPGHTGSDPLIVSGLMLKFFAAIITWLLLRIAYRLFKTLRANPEELLKRRLEFVLLALVFYSLCALHDMLLRHQIFHVFNFPIVQLATLVFMVIVVYATMRFKLIDVDVAIGIGVYYMLLTLGTASVYKCVENLMENYLKNYISSQSFLIQMMPAFSVALLVGFFQGGIQRVIDRFFLKAEYRHLKIFHSPNFQFLVLDSRVDDLIRLRDELSRIIEQENPQK